MSNELRQVADMVADKTLFCTKEVLTSDEAARYMGISKSYLYKLTMLRKIPHYKPMGKMCYFNRMELEQWLQGFYDAEFVITDSFHACVFSIIFNKPFFAVGNPGRGLSRFKSLLAMFGLDDRLLMPDASCAAVPSAVKDICWNDVNRRLAGYAEMSYGFISRLKA